MDVKFVSERNVTWDDSLYTDAQIALTNNYDLGSIEARPSLGVSSYNHGENYYGQTVGPRDIFLEYILKSTTKAGRDAFIRTIKTAFNPVEGLGLLTLTMEGGIERAIWCSMQKEPVCVIGEGRRQLRQTVQLNLHAPYPFWHNPTVNTVSLASFTGGLHFPLVAPIDFGAADQEVTVTVAGDSPTPCLITFNGALTDPRIDLVNDKFPDGKYFKAVMSLLAGETLVINTAQGNHTVRYVSGVTDVNGIGYKDPGSSFFWLEPGQNVLSFEQSTAIGASAGCVVQYYDQYSGV